MFKHVFCCFVAISVIVVQEELILWYVNDRCLFEALVNMLKVNTSLNSISLRTNDIADEGAQAGQVLDREAFVPCHGFDRNVLRHWSYCEVYFFVWLLCVLLRYPSSVLFHDCCFAKAKFVIFGPDFLSKLSS